MDKIKAWWAGANSSLRIFVAAVAVMVVVAVIQNAF